MKSCTYLPLLAVLFALSAAADDHRSVAAATAIHVDIEKVSVAGRVPPVNSVVSAGQPDEAALQAFADAGFTAVIDMRGPGEDRGLANEQASVEALGLDYIAFPIASREEISFASAKRLDAVLQGIEGPVLIHCGSGNRVGALLALRHSLNGADDDEAIAHGKDAGLTRLEDLVRERMSEE